MMHHPGRVWIQTWETSRGYHIRVTDCEQGEYDGNITFLVYDKHTRCWEGHIRQGSASIVLTQRQAIAFFEGFFDWFYDFGEIS